MTGRASRLAALLAVAAFAASHPALAQETDLATLAPLPPEMLQDQRGGFVLDGLTINFGAEIRTFLNGELVLQTNVSWINNQVTSTQIASAALTPVDAEALRGGLLTGPVSIAIGNERVFLANQGQTAIIQPTDGTLQNILINTASNISARQEINASIDVGGYASFRSESVSQNALSQLNGLVNFAASGGLGR